jgi:hypothetical protein
MFETDSDIDTRLETVVNIVDVVNSGNAII